jgi:hypothetical protein
MEGGFRVFKSIQVIILLCGLLVFSGCNHSDSQENDDLALLKTTNPSPADINSKGSKDHVRQIKKDIASFPEIYDVAVLKGEKETLVAYKVKHMQRFKMKSIEKRMNKLLEKKYPDESFIVSSDYKIFIEAVQLREDMKKSNYPVKKAEERFEAITSLKEELT